MRGRPVLAGPGARVLVLAPTRQDAALTLDVLSRAELEGEVCDAPRLCTEAAAAGCLIVAEEALAGPSGNELAKMLAEQPAWSDLPVLVVTRAGADSPTVRSAVEQLGNVTLLERPIRVAALTSAVRTALRARARQYELRDRLEAQALMAAIVSSSGDAIVSKTLQGVIVSWNAGAERIFGYPAAEAVGRHITLIIPPDRLEEERMILARLVNGDRIEHFETIRRRKDGRLIDISLTVSPVYDASGRTIGASKVARDISAQKLAERSLREADQRKDEFLATLAHELRNPLAPIRNALHVLRLTGRDPAVLRVSEMMTRQVDHMVRLVDDLMEVSRITRGKIELRREPVDVAAVLRSAIETSQPVIDAAGHRLTVALPPAPLVVDGDAVRLAQVFANLLNNAARHTEAPGDIWVDACREADDVVVSVRDAGVGISADMLPRVFEMFTQAKGSHRRTQGGLGIGLSLVRSLVQMHGGVVTAASEGPGRGSEFTVRLPTTNAASKVDAPLRLPESVPGIRVLVVDDNADAADSLGLLLGLLGADVRVTHDGASALEALADFQPQMILLDIGMPGLDGYEVAARIRADPEHRGVTLVALTGWGQEEDRRRSRQAGFDYHLIKPTDLDALRALIISTTNVAGAKT